MKDINGALYTFFDGKEPTNLLLKGKWGVGKTYYIKKIFQDVKNKKGPFSKCQVTDCVYVSLFGLRNIEELKMQIVTSIGGAGGFSGRLTKEFAKIDTVFLGIPSLANSWVIEGYLKDVVVCFDDIERRDASFPLAQLLGFVDHLRNEKNCRSILIVNDGELGDCEVILNQYRDKVIDCEIDFNPSVKESYEIALNNEGEIGFQNEIVDLLEKLDCRNIRTIRRALNNTKKILGEFNIQDSDEIHRVTRQVFILTVTRYDYPESFERRDAFTHTFLSVALEKNLEDESLKKVYSLIANTRFVPHPLDETLFEYLRRGYISKDQKEKAITEYDKKYTHLRIDREMERFRDRIWASFEEVEDIVRDFAEYLNARLEELDPKTYFDSIGFLAKIDSDINYEQLRDEYFEKSDFPWHTMSPMILDSLSEDVREKILQELEEHEGKDTIEDIVNRLTEHRNSWDSKDFLLLNERSDSEIRDFLTNPTLPNGAYIAAELIDKIRPDHSGSEKELGEKLQTILNEISDRSQLDRIRLEKAVEKLRAKLQSSV